MTPPLRFDQLDATRQAGIRCNIALLQQKGATEADLEEYLTHDEGLAPAAEAAPAPPVDHAAKLHAEYKAGTLAPRMAAENAQDAATTPHVSDVALGAAASLARDVPGAEALQAAAAVGASHIPGLRPASGPIDYRTALRELHDTEGTAGALGTAARMAGGGLAAAVIPGSATTKGALYGALHGYADANPDMDRAARRDAAVEQGAIGGALGFGGEVLGAAGSRVGSLIKSQAQKERDVIGAIRGAFQKKEATGADLLAGLRKVQPLSATGDIPAGPFARSDLKSASDMFPRPPAPVAPPVPSPPVVAPSPASSSTLTEQMRGMLRKAGRDPDADEWTDAELAMGLNKAPPDLENLLRQSIIRIGGKPIVPAP